MRFLFLFGFLLFVSSLTVSGQDGILDSSFALNGKYLLSSEYSHSSFTKVTTTQDGGILLSVHRSYGDQLCVKLTSNGQLDSSFGINGIAEINTHDSTATYTLLRQLLDGKILVAYSTFSQIVLTRLTPSGQIDPTFGTDGQISYTLPVSRLMIRGLSLDPMNRLIVASRCYANSRHSSIVMRLNLDGSYDQSFGFDGITILSFPTLEVSLFSIAVDSTSNIYLTGASTAPNSVNDNLFVCRITNMGIHDVSFSNMGSVGAVVVHKMDRDTARAIAIQADNKIVVGGYLGHSGWGNFVLLRFLPNSQFDPSFGDNGLVSTSFTQVMDHIHDLVIASDQKIIAAGTVNIAGSVGAHFSEFALARYFPDGTLDQSFGENGKVRTNLSSYDEVILSLCIHPDKNILAAGNCIIDGIKRAALVRYSGGRPYIFITNVSNNVIYTAGTQRLIEWNSFDVATACLELTTDGGTTWNVIPGAEMLATSDQGYWWDVPNTNSEICKIRISDYNNPSTNSVSATFQIKPPSINIVIQAESIWSDFDLNGFETNTVDGSASSVGAGSIIAYQWILNGVVLDSLALTELTLPTGTNSLYLTVTTNLGYQLTKSKRIEVLGAKLSLSGSVLSAVSHSGNLYYVTSQDKSVYGFDSTGAIKRHFQTGGSIQSTLCISSQNRLYVGSDDLRAYCFDNQLNSIWDKMMGGMIKSSPAVSEDGSILYLATSTGIISAVNAVTGALKWSYNTNSNILASPILFQLPDNSNAVIIGTQGSSSSSPALIALKDLGNSAELLWEKQVDGPISSTPAFLTDGLNSLFYFVTENGILHRVRWDGYSWDNWMVDLGSPVTNCSPVIDANGLVYIGTDSAKLLAFDSRFISTSQPVKTFKAASAINATPAIGNTGNLYVGTQNGKFYAIDITKDSLIADWMYDAKVPFSAPALVTETGVVISGATNGEIFLLADPDFNPASEEVYTAHWPTFLGNNRRNRIAKMSVTSLQDIDGLPKTFALNQNYPNPFNPKTVIEYALPKQSQVELRVYDILGMEVALLVNQMQPAGYYSVDFDGVTLPSGVYFYRITASDYTSVKKMLLLK